MKLLEKPWWESANGERERETKNKERENDFGGSARNGRERERQKTKRERTISKSWKKIVHHKEISPHPHPPVPHLAAPSVSLVSIESSGARSLTSASHLGAPVPEALTDPSSCTWTQNVVPGSPALDAAPSSQPLHSAAPLGRSCQSRSCFSRDFSSCRCFSWRERDEYGVEEEEEEGGEGEPKPELLLALPSLAPLSSAFRARSAPICFFRGCHEGICSFEKRM